MLIFNDIFTWKGPITDNENLWLKSCRLWVIDLAAPGSNVEYLRPVIIVAKDISTGPKRKICAETLGKQIFSEFNLDIKRSLWVEYDPDTTRKCMVAVFKPKYHDGSEMIYSIEWRSVTDFESGVIKSHIPELIIEE